MDAISCRNILLFGLTHLTASIAVLHIFGPFPGIGAKPLKGGLLTLLLIILLQMPDIMLVFWKQPRFRIIEISALDKGLFCGISVGIMLNVMTLCSFILFVMCWAVTNSMSYKIVWSKVLWKRFSFLPSVAIIISYVYLCYSCTVDFNPELNEIIKDMLGIENEYPFFEIVLNAVSVIPFILSSHMDNVFVISLIGKAGLLIASGIVCPSFFSKYQKLGFGTLKNGNLFSVSGNCIIQSYGVFNAAAFFHPSIRYIIQDMKSNSQLSIQRIVLFLLSYYLQFSI